MGKVLFRFPVQRVLSITFVFSIMLGFLSVARAETSVALWQGDKKGAVSLTFDGGFSSQFDNAFPLLQQHGLKATVFTLSYDPDEDAVLNLVSDGQEIGSNGMDDWPLTDLDSAWQDHFLLWSQSELQELTGQDVTTFAYPRGVYNADIINKTAVYYIAARTSDTAYPAALNASSPTNMYQLEVINPNDNGDGLVITVLEC